MNAVSFGDQAQFAAVGVEGPGKPGAAHFQTRLVLTVEKPGGKFSPLIFISDLQNGAAVPPDPDDGHRFPACQPLDRASRRDFFQRSHIRRLPSLFS